MKILKLKQDKTRLYLIQPDLSARKVEMRARTTLALLRKHDELGTEIYPVKGVGLYYWANAPRNPDLERKVMVVALESGGALAVAEEDAGWGLQPNLLAICGMPEHNISYFNNYLHANKCWLNDHSYVELEIMSALFPDELRITSGS